MRYKVNFEYTVPEWAEVEVDADSKDDAAILAQAEFDIVYPEAIEPKVLRVEDIG